MVEAPLIHSNVDGIHIHGKGGKRRYAAAPSANELTHIEYVAANRIGDAHQQQGLPLFS